VEEKVFLFFLKKKLEILDEEGPSTKGKEIFLIWMEFEISSFHERRFLFS